MDVLNRKHIMNMLMSRLGANGGGIYNRNMARQGRSIDRAAPMSAAPMSDAFARQSAPQMTLATPGGRVPWQKGKALEDYAMKKLKERDNEEFYKNFPMFGRRPRVTTPLKSLQDYGDWDEDEQDPMFSKTPKIYRNPMFDTMLQNNSRMRF